MLKKVTFNTAKALKNAGYPQNPYNDTLWFDLNGEQISDDAVIDDDVDINTVCAAPTYLEVWLWLWRKKRWFIKIQPFKDKFCYQILDHHYDEWHSWGVLSTTDYSDPEEAIENAIEHLVNNNLIK